jgi:hypothetical protein
MLIRNDITLANKEAAKCMLLGTYECNVNQYALNISNNVINKVKKSKYFIYMSLKRLG